MQHPIEIFDQWFQEALKKEKDTAHAMSLATFDMLGFPDVRMVLLKSFDMRGFVFFTNLESRKGKQLLSFPKAALCFFWPKSQKQIRIIGTIEMIAEREADAYFASRGYESQIGAWASQQSRPMHHEKDLERGFSRYAAQFRPKQVPRPPYWCGIRTLPLSIEFWEERPFRLHKRTLFTKEETKWRKEILYP